MRVLFLTDLPWEISPSAWVNARQLQPYLQSQGFDVDVLGPTSAATYHSFMDRRRLPGRGFAYMYLLRPVCRLSQILSARRYHVVVVVRSLAGARVPPVLERMLRRLNSRLVYHIDDALYLRAPNQVDARIRLAAAVWAATPPIAEHAWALNDQVWTIASGVDTNHYRPKPDYSLHSPVTIVWTGNPGNARAYLPLVAGPLSELSRRYALQIKVICRERYRFEEGLRLPVSWEPFSRVREAVSLRAADIAISPLTDGPYQRCKGNYKTKVFMACGLPTVCSPVGNNLALVKDGKTGMFAASQEEWVECISTLIENGGLRQSLGTNASQYIQENFSIEETASRVGEMLRAVGGAAERCGC